MMTPGNSGEIEYSEQEWNRRLLDDYSFGCSATELHKLEKKILITIIFGAVLLILAWLVQTSRLKKTSNKLHDFCSENG